jgi:hypothetical protein
VLLNKEDTYDFDLSIDKVSYEEKNDYLYFLVSDKYSPIRDSISTADKDYSNKLFEELTARKYSGEKYLICSDTNYIRIYNCFNNLLIASYDKEFSSDQRSVTTAFRMRTDANQQQVVSGRYFVFYLKRGIFDPGFQFVDVTKINN